MKRFGWLGSAPTDWLAAALMALSGFCLVVAMWLESGNGAVTLNSVSPGWEDAGALVIFFGLPVFGGLLALRQPTNPLGWLLSAGGTLFAVGLLGHAWAIRALIVEGGEPPFGQLAAWTATWVFIPGFGLLALSVARFPDGTVSAHWLARLERIAIAAVALLAVAQAFAPDHLDGVAPGTPIPNPLGVQVLEAPIAIISAVAVALLIAYVGMAIIDLARRVRVAPPELRAQLRWVALALTPVPLLVAVVVFETIAGFEAAVDATVYGGQVVILVGLAMALTRMTFGNRLFGRSRMVDRTLVLALLTGALALAYVALVAAVGTVVSNNTGLSAAIAAGAAAAAMLLTPLRGALQRRVNRVVFGTSADPFAVVDALVARLDAAGDQPTAAAAIVSAIASTTRVPYAAIEFGSSTVAEHGAPDGDPQRFPITTQGTTLGFVAVGLPAGSSALTPRDRDLIDRIVRHAGPALHAQKLAGDVERARTETVAAREAERQQLRRDLHDGIGPSLAGIALQLDAIRTNLDDATASTGFERINTDLANTVAEVRRVTRGLRPPTLDDLGLLGALHERCCSLNASFTHDVSMDEARELPAAVEVAIYHIASEALTNVARHARASRCEVTLRIDPRAVNLEVADDGVGPPTGDNVGVGLSSMRSRAQELGGTLEVSNNDPGVRVRCHLPLDAART